MINERPVGALLHALRRLVVVVGLYPAGHPLTAEALTAADGAVGDLAGAVREIVFNLLGDALYHNGSVLPHVSLEFSRLIRDMNDRGVESITLIDPVSEADLLDLAAFVAGVSDDLPADGTIRLNESLLSKDEIESTPLSKMRRSYSRSLDALRMVTGSMVSHGAFEMNAVVGAVAGLAEHTVAHSAASLLLATVKSHDEYTFFHSVNTCILALAAGRRIGIPEDHLLAMGVGAVLHDIGKVAVSADTLHHPGRLGDDMWKEIKLHPQEGALAIMAAGGQGHEIAATVAFEHHARYDGSGYPTVSRTTRPHPYSRVVSVADTYDAITTRRSYRRAETPRHALDVLAGGADTMYDPMMVNAFSDLVGIHPPGTILETVDGALMLVIEAEREDGAPLAVLAIKSADGALIDPDPQRIPPDRIVRQVLPSEAEIDPAAYLETVLALET